MSNYINKYLDQSAYDADSTKQYPNTSLVGTDVVFQMTEPTPVAFGGLTVKYNIPQSDLEQEIGLFNGGGASSGSSESSSESGGGGVMPTTMIVDGVSETPINTWRFETAGEHIVQYTFADNTVPQGFLSIGAGATPATDVIVGTDITNIGSQSFYKELTSATCLSTTPPTIGDVSVFGGGSYDYPIYVPASSVSTYKAATIWSSLETRIQAIQ